MVFKEKAEIYFQQGSSYDAQGKLEKAIADYTQAIALDPQFANALLQAKSYLSKSRK